MKQKSKLLEAIGVLSVSLVISTTLCISSCIPEMMKTFPEYDRSALESLISMSQIAIFLIILITPFLTRLFSERAMICIGLTLIGAGGVMPLFLENYVLIAISRLILGAGVGFINTRAISMVVERFDREACTKLQGIRCSMEAGGQCFLMFIAGLLLGFGWHYAYLVYLFAFVIMVVFLLLVPKREKQAQTANRGKLSWAYWRRGLLYALLSFLLLSNNAAFSIRIPSVLVERGMGTAQDSSLILSAAVLLGLLGGLFFGRLFKLLRKAALPVFLLADAVGIFLLAAASNIVMVTAGALINGFFIVCCISYVFNCVTAGVPENLVDMLNVIPLCGCNLGVVAAAPFLKCMDSLSSNLQAAFFVYGAAFALVALAFIVRCMIARGKAAEA